MTRAGLTIQYASYAMAWGPSGRHEFLKMFGILQYLIRNSHVAYMSVMVSNCPGEQSFSKMALIKNKLHSTMSDRCLARNC